MNGINIEDGFGNFILLLITLGIIIGAMVVGGIRVFSHEEGVIKSEIPIEPQIELFINKNGEVDTLYVYKKLN